MIKVLGVGLSKTGTNSLTDALKLLGYKTIHYDAYRLNDVILEGKIPANWRRYDTVDAVTDIPSAYFYREILDAYPEAKAILTVRDVDAWYASICKHYRRYKEDFWGREDNQSKLIKSVREMVWGSYFPNEYIYKKTFTEHNERVQTEVSDLLVMDVAGGDGWEKLCPYLGEEIPDEPFPHKNSAREWNAQHRND